eukprot:TRINITY_DN191_c3_g1_i3.p1 TRINITY_DN191_c3_g1~~TRINITY_DN191_c3_g1_i3.p1  ORF type:complete len:280 (-),score=66.88 TRINITY_DN191_c3_g1_i3:129-860(-)
MSSSSSSDGTSTITTSTTSTTNIPTSFDLTSSSSSSFSTTTTTTIASTSTSTATSTTLTSSSSSSLLSSSEDFMTLSGLPDLVWDAILRNTPIRTLCALPSVSRHECALLAGPVGEAVWQDMCFRRRPLIPIKVKNWKKFYRRRHVVCNTDPYVPSRASKVILPIENCLEWEFKCPIAYERLQNRNPFEPRRFCDVCKRDVQMVRTVQDLEQKVRQGECVTLDLKDAYSVGKFVPNTASFNRR